MTPNRIHTEFISHLDTAYYLPGMGGRFNTGLGRGIHDRGYKAVGRETLGEFQKYSF